MSDEDNTETEVADMCCANCGKAEVDDIKLRDCDKCDLARYCGDVCQQNHRPEHRVICTLRVAELRDELLFRQPEETHLGDCPICFLPVPIDEKKSAVYSCCGKFICSGCVCASLFLETEQRNKHKCPFCRKSEPKTDGESRKRLMNRAEANDPVALRELGAMKRDEGDYESAFKCWTKAAELGDAMAHFDLSVMYRKGAGVEKDDEKSIYHLEEAAIAGNPDARYNLGCHEWNDERYDRAVKHWIIAANLGEDSSLTQLKTCFKPGHVSKDDLAAALRAHQAAVDATKSPQREAADALNRLGEGSGNLS